MRLARAYLFVATGSVVVLLLLAGCGGGGSGSSASEPPITKKRFQHKAQAICYRSSKEQVRRIALFYKRHGLDAAEPSQRAREMVNAAVVLPVESQRIEELGALPAPEGDEAKVRAILESMERGVSESEAHPEWLASPTRTHPSPFQESLDLTNAYGIWPCGEE